LGSLASSHIALGNRTEAHKLISQLVNLCEKAEPRHDGIYGNVLRGLAEEYLVDGDSDQAIATLTKAVHKLERSGSEFHRERIESLRTLARLRLLRGEQQAAITIADAAQRALADDLRYTLSRLAEHRQMAYVHDTFVSVFHEAISLVAGHDDDTTAEVSAGWVLNGKGIVSQVLGERAVHLRLSDVPEVVRIRTELQEVRGQLARASIAVAGEDVFPQLEKERTDRVAALAAKEHSLADQLAAFAGGAPHRGWVELANVRKELPPEAVLIEYVLHAPFDFNARSWKPTEYFAWLIPAEGKGVVRVVPLGPADRINATIEKLQAVIHASRDDIDYEEVKAEAAIRRQLRAVADMVLVPLESAIADSKRWLISADGPLWLVPWGALQLKGGEYAIEHHQISHVVSGRDVVTNAHVAAIRAKVAQQYRAHLVVNGTKAYFKERRTPSALGLVIADPNFDLAAPTDSPRSLLLPTTDRGAPLGPWGRLPGTATEAKAAVPLLREFLHADPVVRTGAEATLAEVLGAVAPKVLVLSTHGFFLSTESPGEGNAPTAVNPLLLSGLVLAGANANRAKGLLTALDVVDLDLSGTELVVLSACDSGIGVVQAGDGVIGLRHAFRIAGAETVIATLWKVPDHESAELMTLFWEQLKDGENASDALRTAQLQIIETRRAAGKTAHPYYWAAFNSTGQTIFPEHLSSESSKPKSK
jgi:CHAT domain-containing protein